VNQALGSSGRRGLAARLGGETLVYGFGGVANQAVAVLLVPIYARQLGPSGVGVTGVLNSTISLSLMLAGLALPQAFFRWYLRESSSDIARSNVLRTILAVRIAGSLLAFALVLLAVIPITDALYGGANLAVFALVAPIVMLDSFNQIPLSFLRAERRPGDYIRITLTRAILASVLTVVLVVLLNIGVIGVAIGSASAAAASAVIGAWIMVRVGARPRLDGALTRVMLAFALPLVPASIAGWVLNLLDRPLLQIMTGSASVVGVYSLGYTVGLMTNALVVQPFSLAWGAAHWEISQQPDATRNFSRVLTWFLLVASGAALVISAFGTDAIRILVGENFELSRFVVPFSAFAYVLYGAYSVVSAGLGIVGRSSLVAISMGVAAATSVVLNLVLIPVLGLFGAATSTLASYFLLMLLSGVISQRHYPVRWSIGTASVIFGTALALSAAALLGPDHALWRLGCVAAYPTLMVVSGLVSLSALRDVIRTVIRSGRT
jgi:O-antigen/teichoic acid export membrane protein